MLFQILPGINYFRSWWGWSKISHKFSMQFISGDITGGFIKSWQFQISHVWTIPDICFGYYHDRTEILVIDPGFQQFGSFWLLIYWVKHFYPLYFQWTPYYLQRLRTYRSKPCLTIQSEKACVFFSMLFFWAWVVFVDPY